MKRLLTALVFVVFLCGTAQAEFFDLGFTDGTDPLTPYMDSWVLEKNCSETEEYAVDFDPITTTDVKYNRSPGVHICIVYPHGPMHIASPTMGQGGGSQVFRAEHSVFEHLFFTLASSFK